MLMLVLTVGMLWSRAEWSEVGVGGLWESGRV